MVVNYILLFVVVLIFVIINSIRLLYTTKGFYLTLNEMSAFWSIAFLVFQLVMSVFIFYDVRGLNGIDGPPGLDGPVGKSGKNGKCLATCGQKVCNVLVLNSINAYFKKRAQIKSPIKNRLFLNKINKICFSDNYYGMLITKHKNRPNEKTLIEYIERLYKTWVDLLLNHPKGKSFLLSENAQTRFFGKYKNPFDEIEKYDIWQWGAKYKYKPILRIQCAKKTNKPSGTDQEIYVFYTNKDYNLVSDTSVRSNTYGPEDCPYDQLGKDFTNPRGLTKCYYFDSKNNNQLKDVYLKTRYKNYRKSVSFFNTPPFSSENNQQFFALGSVWRGNDKEHRSRLKNYVGPEKFTILVSGRTETPIDYELIWTNSKNCEDCFDLEDIISIWRAVCPEGYVSLGDLVIKGTDKPELDMIRVIKKEYVKEVPLNKSVWTEEGFAKETFNEEGKKTDTQKLGKLSIWPIGYNFTDEEKINQKRRDIEYSGGYSLFRATNNHRKPIEKAYLLRDEFIYKINSPGNLGQNTELGFGWLGGKPREGKYSIYNYLGITTYGIITNNDTNFSPDGLGKSYYIQNINGNLYGIKALNPKTNLFEHYYQTNDNSEFTFVENLSRTNPNMHWELVFVRDENDELKTENELPLVHLRNKVTNKFFTQRFDSQGLNNESESTGSTGSIFQFQSYNGDIMN